MKLFPNDFLLPTERYFTSVSNIEVVVDHVVQKARNSMLHQIESSSLSETTHVQRIQLVLLKSGDLPLHRTHKWVSYIYLLSYFFTLFPTQASTSSTPTFQSSPKSNHGNHLFVSALLEKGVDKTLRGEVVERHPSTSSSA
jgi:hypothetical protein